MSKAIEDSLLYSLPILMARALLANDNASAVELEFRGFHTELQSSLPPIPGSSLPPVPQSLKTSPTSTTPGGEQHANAMRIFTHRAVSNYHRTSPPCSSPSNSTVLDAAAEALDDKALVLPRDASLWQDGATRSLLLFSL